MNIFSLVSMKGGTGKTSLTAAIASALASRLGKNRVLVIDFDFKNLLGWHLGTRDAGIKGMAHAANASHGVEDGAVNRTINALVRQSASGVRYLPYGDASEFERKQFEASLLQNPSWLEKVISSLGLDHDCVVLIDTPPGHSIYQTQAFRASSMAVSVVLPDAASFATVASMETALQRGFADKASVYVVNQYDQRQVLGTDVVNVLRQQLAKRVAPIFVSYDEGVREALAVQQTCLQYDPHSQASHDVDQLSQWLIKLVNSGATQ